MAGGAASAVSVIGGGFLHPIGNKAKHAETRTRLTNLALRKSICFSSTLELKFDEMVCGSAPSPCQDRLNTAKTVMQRIRIRDNSTITAAWQAE
jgi:hypothetical protein